MRITVEVALYTEGPREVVYVEITEKDIHDMAERKAEKENTCTACAAIMIEYQLDN